MCLSLCSRLCHWGPLVALGKTIDLLTTFDLKGKISQGKAFISAIFYAFWIEKSFFNFPDSNW